MTVYELTPRDLADIGFSDHAIERFAERAGLASSWRSSVEPIIRDLLRQEGMLADRAPKWARSENTADWYAQLGDWMLFILRPDNLYRDRLTAVTVINGPVGNDWANALRRGFIYTPPPPTLDPLPSTRVRLRDVIHEARDMGATGPTSMSLWRRLRIAYDACRRDALALYASVDGENRRRSVAYERARQRARELHARRLAARAG